MKVKSISNKAGMTVIEIILVILFLGLTGVGLLRNLDLSDPTAVTTARNKVAHDVRFAQHRALVTGIAHGFRTLSTTSYEIYQQTPGNAILDPLDQKPMQVSLATNFQDTSFQQTYQVEFDAFGRPTIGGGNSITLTNGTHNKNFTVTQNTGTVITP